MALIVQKFGGTSVGSPERIKNVARTVIKEKLSGNQVIVVVSAMSGQTDALISLCKQVSDNPSKREMDMMVSTGEQVTIALLAMALIDQGHDAISYNGWQVGIRTTDEYSKAKILDIDTKLMRESLDAGNILVVAGFQGIDRKNNITTLGRGGSDTTAVAVAAALKADRCDIYTDVDGIYTADPRVVPDARRLDRISHDEMLELASMGSKVLHDRSVIFAMKYNVPLRVVSSFTEGPGTLIVKETNDMEDVLISGIAKKDNEVRVNIAGIPDKPGVASSIFKQLADASINVNMIVQSVGKEGFSQISFTVMNTDLDEAKKVMAKLQTELGAESVTYDADIAIVSVVGVGMKVYSGVAAAVFDELAKNSINIEMISTSEIKISVVIRKADAEKTVQALHRRFFMQA